MGRKMKNVETVEKNLVIQRIKENTKKDAGSLAYFGISVKFYFRPSSPY